MDAAAEEWSHAIGLLFCKNGIESSPLEQSYFLWRMVKDQYPHEQPTVRKMFVENDFLEASFITFCVDVNGVTYDPAGTTYNLNRRRLLSAYEAQHDTYSKLPDSPDHRHLVTRLTRNYQPMDCKGCDDAFADASVRFIDEEREPFAALKQIVGLRGGSLEHQARVWMDLSVLWHEFVGNYSEFDAEAA